MKTALLAALATISLAIPADAMRQADDKPGCREIQREVQLTLAEQATERGGGEVVKRGRRQGVQLGRVAPAHRSDRGWHKRRHGGRHHQVVAAVRILREYKRNEQISKSCGACILREFARKIPIGDQSPCGAHDLCVAGAALGRSDDECVAQVCERKPFCCFAWWTDRCVNAAQERCDFRCDVCAHDTCTEGVALPRHCDECSDRVCATDPYCCDSAWDEHCVARASLECEPGCVEPTTTTTTSTTTTTTTSSTTSSTSTTTTSTTTTTLAAPQPQQRCAVDSHCDDGNDCTNDFCEADGSCSYRNNRAPCEDGNLCTLNDRCSFGTCRGGPRMNCDDSNACTFDWCHNSGECRHRTISCNDADRCTTDSCDPASGCVYGVTDCDDGDSCTQDGCHSSLGCVHAPEPVCSAP